jgi:hypothetical protein
MAPIAASLAGEVKYRIMIGAAILKQSNGSFEKG